MNHVDDCYFCLTNVCDSLTKNKNSIFYPNLSSAIRPVLHSNSTPVPIRPDVIVDVPDECYSESSENESNKIYEIYEPDKDWSLELFTQGKLNGLVRYLNLSKDSAEVFGSKLKDKNFLTPNVNFVWCYYREPELVPIFKEKDSIVIAITFSRWWSFIW